MVAAFYFLSFPVKKYAAKGAIFPYFIEFAVIDTLVDQFPLNQHLLHLLIDLLLVDLTNSSPLQPLPLLHLLAMQATLILAHQTTSLETSPRKYIFLVRVLQLNLGLFSEVVPARRKDRVGL